MSAVWRWLETAQGRTWGWVGVMVVAVGISLVLGIQTRRATSKRIAAGYVATGVDARQVNDLDRFLELERGFVREKKGYVDDGFPYPPMMIVLMAPLMWLGNADAQLVWTLCKPVMAGLILWWGWLMVKRSGKEFHPLAMGVVFFALMWPYERDVQNGQTNLLMLLPLVGGLAAAQAAEMRNAKRESQNGDRGGAVWLQVLAGMLLGLAAAIKVTPAVFLIYFLWRRRWVVAGSMLAGLGLCFYGVPVLLFGWGQNQVWLEQWSRVMILPYTETGLVEYNNTQSVASFLKRWLMQSPAFKVNGVEQFIGVADLSAEVVKWTTRGVLGGLAVAGLIWMRRGLKSFVSGRYVVEVGCVAAFMLWASERSWIHHYVTMVLPLLAAAMVVSDGGIAWSRRRWVAGAMGLVAVGMLLTSDAGKVLGAQGAIWAQAFGVCLIPSMVLVVVMCVNLKPETETVALKG